MLNINVSVCDKTRAFPMNIPDGALVLGVIQEEPWKHATRCALGVLGPRRDVGGWHTVADGTTENGPEVRAFLEAVQREPANVWIVAPFASFEILSAIALLQLRVAALSLGKKPPEPPFDGAIMAYVRASNASQRFIRRWDDTWPGLQGGYSFSEVWKQVGDPAEVRMLAPVAMLARWVKDERIAFPLEQALTAIAAWIDGGWHQTRKGTQYTLPPEIARAAAGAGKWSRVLEAAFQQATRERYEIVERFEAAQIGLERLFSPPYAAQLDLTGGGPIPKGAEDIGFCVAPVVITLFREQGLSQVRVSWFHERHFDHAGFHRAVVAADSLHREWLPMAMERGDSLRSPLNEHVTLTGREMIWDLVKRHLR